MDGYLRWVVFGIVVVSFLWALLSFGGVSILGLETVEAQNSELGPLESVDNHETLGYSNQEVAALNIGQSREFNKAEPHRSIFQSNNADASTFSTSTVDWVEPPPSEVVEDTVFSVTLEGNGQDEVCLVDEGWVDDAIDCRSVDGEFTETFTVDVESDLDNDDSTLYAGVDDDNPFGYIPADETSYEDVEVIPDPVYWEEQPPSEVEENSTLSLNVGGQREGEVCLVHQKEEVTESIGCEAIDGEYTVKFSVDVATDLNNENATLYAEVNGGEYTTNEVAVQVVPEEEIPLIVEMIAFIITIIIFILIIGGPIVLIASYFGLITLPSLRGVLVALIPSVGDFSGQSKLIDKYTNYSAALDTELSISEKHIRDIRNPDSIKQRLKVEQREKAWRRIEDATTVYDRYTSFLQQDPVKVDSQALEELISLFEPHRYDSLTDYEEDKALLLSIIDFVEWLHRNEPETLFNNAKEAYWSLVPDIPATMGELRVDANTIEQRQDTIKQFNNQLNELDSLASTECKPLINENKELIDNKLSEIQSPRDAQNFEQTVTQLHTICDIYNERVGLDSSHVRILEILTKEGIQNPKRNESAVDTYRALHDLQDFDVEYFEKQLDHIEEELINTIQSELTSTKKIENLQQLLEKTCVLVEFMERNATHPLVDSEEWRTEIKKALEEQYPKRLQPYIKQINRMEDTFWEKDDLYSFDWGEFEHLVGTLFEAEGYNVEVTDGTRDLGVDVWARNHEQNIAVQVKQFGDGNRVGREPLQKLASTLAKGTADKIIVVTSSSFTKTAKDYAQDFGPEIELVDGEDLIRRLIQADVPPPA
jgi:restriction endonuclease Mrr